jgi:hypothetical protein
MKWNTKIMTNRNRVLCCAGLLVSWVGGLAAEAEVLLHESFDYPDGPLTQVAGGRWERHSGSQEEVEVAGGQVRLTQSESEDVHILLGEQSYATNASLVLYAALKMNFEQLPRGAGGGYWAHFKDAANGFRGRVFATTNGAALGRFRLGVASAANAASALHPRDLDLNTAYTVVIRYAISQATISLWIDPQSEAEPGATSTDPGSPVAIAAFALRQSLSSGNGMGALVLDDLKVATGFGDLVEDHLEPPREPIIGALRLGRVDSQTIRLEWDVQPGIPYTVWMADQISGDYVALASEVLFTNASGYFIYQMSSDNQQRFYRVSAP